MWKKKEFQQRGCSADGICRKKHLQIDENIIESKVKSHAESSIAGIGSPRFR